MYGVTDCPFVRYNSLLIKHQSLLRIIFFQNLPGKGIKHKVDIQIILIQLNPVQAGEQTPALPHILLLLLYLIILALPCLGGRERIAWRNFCFLCRGGLLDYVLERKEPALASFILK